jgi:hypothetical protein
MEERTMTPEPEPLLAGWILAGFLIATIALIAGVVGGVLSVWIAILLWLVAITIVGALDRPTRADARAGVNRNRIRRDNR